MSSDQHHACDCAAHRHATAAPANQRGEAGLWASLLPVLACAVCPACIATYAKLLSLVGVGLELSELQHAVILAFALAASLGVSAWRSIRTHRVWPIALASLGSALVVLGHVGGDLHVVEWAGVLVLLVSGLFEHYRLRRAVQAVTA